MRRQSLPFLALCFSVFAASCGDAASDSSGADGASSSGTFTVSSARPTPGSTTGASYTLQVSFTGSPTECTTATVGACTVNPCYRSTTPSDSNVPLPSAGQVNLLAPHMTPIALGPQSDGSYLTESVDGQLPWTAGGQPVTLAWSHFPGNPSQPGDLVTLSTPAYVALVEGSAFDAILSTLSRADDLNLAWTSDTAPAVSDEVVFSVSAVSTQVYCTFGAATGAGVVPAAALGQLETGEASYNVHSKQFARESLTAANGAPWTLSFNIDATARTSYGLANGYVTLQ